MTLVTALRLGRVSNLPTTWSNVAAGLVLSGAAVHPALALALCAAISLLYVGGMYLNDAFDRGYDARERPERPIPSGQVRAGTVFALGFGMLAAGVAIVAAAAETGPAPLLAAVALAGLIVLYDAYHKGNPLSPLLMALTRVLVYVTAALAARVAFTPLLGAGCAALLCYLVGLTYAAKQENLREPSGFWPLLFLGAPFLFAPAMGAAAGIAAYLLLAASTAFGLRFLLVRGARDVKRAVSQLIASISLLDAMLVASQHQTALAAACVLCFAATRLAQRVIPGT